MTISDFRHPQEIQQLEALQQVKVLSLILNIFNSAYASITSFATVAERNYPVSAHTEPRLHRLYTTAKNRLGVSEDVPIYLKFDYAIDAETIGTDGNCAIVVSSCALESLSDDELLALMGRELGHIAYQHVKYVNIVRFFDDVTQKLSGIAEAAVSTAKNLLIEWLRCANYTADRAGAVASGSAEAPCMVLAKAMGLPQFHPQIRFDLKQFISEPLPPFPEEKLGKFGQIAFQNLMTEIQVPFGTVRMKELWTWSRSDGCRQDFPHVYYSNSWAFGLEDQTDAGMLCSRGEAAFDRSKEDGLALLHRAARCGSARAMCILGRIYLEGHIVKRDASHGVRYLQFAVAAKEPAAYTQLGICCLNGVPGVLQQNEDLGCRLLRCGRDKGDAAAQRHLLKYRAPSVDQVKALDTAVSGYAAKAVNPQYYLLKGKMQEARNWYAYLDIPNGETLFVLAVNQDYPGQYLAICSSGVYYLTGKTLPQYSSWKTLTKKKLKRSESFGRIDLLAEEELLYSCDMSTVSRSVIPLLESICKHMG